MQALAKRAGIRTVGVPAFDVRGTLIVGYGGERSTGARIRALLDGRAPRAHSVEPEWTCEDDESGASECAPSHDDEEAATAVELPLFGRLSASAVGLPLFTIALGLVDGFNPCAMWVLLFLLTLLINLKSRRKMLMIAGIFVLTSGLVYFAFMAAWLNVFLIIGLSRGVQIGFGAVAAFAGAIHVKDFFAYHRGITLSIPESAKPKLYARARRVLNAENTFAALFAAAILAIAVNFVELLCTAGLPAIYTQILAAQGLSRSSYYGYLALYNLAYVADDALMVTIAVVTLSRRRLDEKEGRWLKLISGLVMLTLAGLLLFAPSWLAP
jgi:hypothetical protein